MLFTGCLPFKMPRFYKDPTIEGENSESGPEAETDLKQTGNVSTTRVRFWTPLLVLTFCYYFISCGIERIYQPMVSAPIFLPINQDYQ